MKTVLVFLLIAIPGIAAAQLSVAVDVQSFNPKLIQSATGGSFAVGKSFNNFGARLGMGLVFYPETEYYAQKTAIPVFVQFEYLNTKKKIFPYFSGKAGYQFGNIFSSGSKGGIMIDGRAGISLKASRTMYVSPFAGYGFVEANGVQVKYSSIGITLQVIKSRKA
jgi:hypothetical protein